MFNWGAVSIYRMTNVRKSLVKCATVSLSEMTYSDMTIPYLGGWRSALQQRGIFTRKCSQLDGVKKKSYHQSGNALDVIPYNSKNDELSYYIFATLMFKNWQKLGFKGKLEWGGHWKNFVDFPHWQVKDVD